MHTDALGDEHRFRLLVEAIEDYAVYMLDPLGIVATWNPGAERNKGYKAAEIVGRSFSTFFLPEDAQAGVPDSMLQHAREKGSFRGAGWRRRKDGSVFWASVVLSAVRDESGELVGFAKVTHDLTERRQREEAVLQGERALQLEHERLRTTLQSIGDGVICTDAEGRVTLMNAAAETLTGWPFEEAHLLAIEAMLALEQQGTAAPVANPARECLGSGRTVRDSAGTVLVSRQGSRSEVQVTASPMLGQSADTAGCVVVVQDVTRLRLAQREIEFNANHDALTLLPNRHFFEQELGRTLESVRAVGGDCAVCFLDLDRFKIINDTAGHTAGDALLRQVAALLAQHVRSVDLVARLGGDEFAIVLKGCTMDKAEELLTTMCEAIAALSFRWEDRLFRVSASLGLATVDRDSTPVSVMKQADVACYSAKHLGRNRISVYRHDQGDGHERQQQLNMAAEIRQALREDRFTLFAQKIVSLEAGGGERYEILVRMLSPEGAILQPAQFIPAAERYDLMNEIDRWVICNALRAFGPLVESNDTLHLSINLSANSLNDENLLSFLLQVTTAHRVPMHRLMFEITESALINNLAEATTLIQQLRQSGCTIALDDFGIGLCSFNYLRSFAVDYIKIDGSFVRNIQSNAIDHAIVSAISDIARQVEAKTIAEFVEDEPTLETLRNLRINHAQGYAIGRPEPFAGVIARHSASAACTLEAGVL